MSQSLVEVAQEAIAKSYQYGRHQVGCAVRMKSGLVFTGISLEAERFSVCSEWVALGKALADDQSGVAKIVAVKQKRDGGYQIYVPCCLCRDLLLKYAPEAEVIIPEGTVPVRDLLPHAWKFVE